MTPDEFEFWQAAYLAALVGITSDPFIKHGDASDKAAMVANVAKYAYRTAKATVVDRIQGVGPAGD